MKLNESFPSTAQPGSDAPAVFRFTLEQGHFAGKTFSATLDICRNPCCPCGAISFQCLPIHDAIAPDGALVREPVDFDLDVLERSLNTQVKSSPAAVALGRAVVAELQPPDWDTLADFFLATKRHQMKTMNLATVPARFPAEVTTDGGSMVGYTEVFPWAEPCDFKLGAEWWLADDQYCVRPGCACTQTALTFFPLPERAPSPRDKVKPETSLRYDYVSRMIELIETRPDRPAADRLIQALQATRPDFGKALRQRHGQLKQLGRRLLPKSPRPTQRPLSSSLANARVDAAETWLPQGPTPQIAQGQARPGRNDPCPCGSGKKFNKCCGASA